MKIDHLVVNVDVEFEKDRSNVIKLGEAGYPYEPKWGKGTRGFKASNIWIGEEYFELVYLKNETGGGWKGEWVDQYNKGYRGLIGLCVDVEDIEDEYRRLSEDKVDVSKPEFLRFKWFFNLLTRTMPWKNSYIQPFKGVPFQIFLQQMKDEKARGFMKQYMVPNSRENKINGIKGLKITGKLTSEDKELIEKVFAKVHVEDKVIKVTLKSGQFILFEESDLHEVFVYTDCKNAMFIGRSAQIENITIVNESN